MTHAPIRPLRATTVIFSVLAMGSTSAWAQDAALSLATPPASAPAAPSTAPQQPALELPAEAPALPPPAALPSLASQPVNELSSQTRAPAETASAPAKAIPAPGIAQRPAARHAAAAAPAVSATRSLAGPQPQAASSPRADEPMPPAAPVLLAPPVVAPAPAARETTAADSGRGPEQGAWIATLLIALGAGISGIVAMRSRRRRTREGYLDSHWNRPARARSGPSIANTAFAGLGHEALPEDSAIVDVEDVTGNPVVLAAEPTPHASAAQQAGSVELTSASAAAPADGPFVIPAGQVPQARAERDALLEAMVTARPDAENPFTSRKARLRRARIILQSLEHEQKEKATKPFDWRTYKPPTSHPAPAAPPRVTV